MPPLPPLRRWPSLLAAGAFLGALLSLGVLGWARVEATEAATAELASLVAAGEVGWDDSLVAGRLESPPLPLLDSAEQETLRSLRAGATESWVAERAADEHLEPGQLPLALLLRRELLDGRAGHVLSVLEGLSSEERKRYRTWGIAARLQLGDVDRQALRLPYENHPSASETKSDAATAATLIGTESAGTPANHRVAPFERRLAELLEIAQSGSIPVFDRDGRLLGRVARTESSRPGVELDPRGAATGLSPWVLEQTLLDSRSRVPTADAGGLRSTIDLSLTETLKSVLGGERGTIVVVGAGTGDVLAAVSDDATETAGGAVPPFARQAFEPASIAKLITAAAAAHAGTDLDEAIRAQPCHGSVSLSGGPLWCPAVAGRLTGFAHALAVSCNTSFARLGLLEGRDAVIDSYRRFGFAGPGEPSRPGFGRIRHAIVTDRHLADLSIGLDVSEITPLHAALMASALAGDGIVRNPQWLAAVDGRLGLTPHRLVRTEDMEGDVPVADVLTLVEMRTAMLAVTDRGTARNVSPPGFRAAMKTGTAREPGQGFHVNYIGFAPADAPRFAYAVRVTDRPTSRRVRRAGYWVTRNLLEALKVHAERQDSAEQRDDQARPRT